MKFELTVGLPRFLRDLIEVDRARVRRILGIMLDVGATARAASDFPDMEHLPFSLSFKLKYVYLSILDCKWPNEPKVPIQALIPGGTKETGALNVL